MTVWNPPKKVSSKEFVGRRAFGSRVFENPSDGRLHYKIDAFLDKRTGTGLSVDRLGVRTAYHDVLAFLCPLCDEMAKKGSTEFIGWAQIAVKDIQKLVQATKAVGEDNPYHAEIDRSGHVNIEALRSFAFRLCVHASKHPFIYRPPTL